MVPCHGLNCAYGCKPTGKGPACFCPEGMQPHKNECIGNDFSFHLYELVFYPYFFF